MVSSRRAVIEVEVPAVARGAVPGLAAGAVAAGAARLLDVVADGSPLAAPLLLAVVAGLACGGWVAARSCTRNPLAHAGLAGVVAVAVLSGVGVAAALASGDTAHWPYVGVWLLLGLAAGTAGGLAALRAPRRRADSGL